MNPGISQDEAADDVSAEQAARVTCANCSAQVHDEDTRILADRSVWCNHCFENDGGTCEHCDGAFSYDALGAVYFHPASARTLPGGFPGPLAGFSRSRCAAIRASRNSGGTPTT